MWTNMTFREKGWPSRTPKWKSPRNKNARRINETGRAWATPRIKISKDPGRCMMVWKNSKSKTFRN